MSKKNIIFLVVAVIILIIGIGIFVFAKVYTSTDEDSVNIDITDEASINKPDGFVFYDENGNEYSISNYENTPIVLLLWSSDTEYSFEVVELIEEVYSEYKSEVIFLIINTEEKSSTITETIANCGYSFKVYYDTENLASTYYDYNKLPTLIFLNEDGTKSNQIEGDITEDALLANLDIIAGNY